MSRRLTICRVVLVIGIGIVLAAIASAQPQAKLASVSKAAYDYAGASVALSLDTIVVGAHQNDGVPNPIGGAGVAYVYVNEPQGWVEQGALLTSAAGNGDWFGAAVAIDFDLAVVGAPQIGPGSDTGSAYAFGRTLGNWFLEAELVAPGLADGDNFGDAVAIDGDTAVVGAPWGAGIAYVYERNGGSWPLTHQLVPAAGSDFAANFGSSVAIDGDRIAIGAAGFDGQSYDSGAVYVFDKVGGSWVESARLMASDGTVVTYVGQAVDLDGDTLLVGSQNDAAYVFTYDGANWVELVKLTADAAPGEQFGTAVAIDGDRLLVGAEQAGGAGAAYLFQWDGATYALSARLAAGDGASGDRFGAAVAIDGDAVVVGAPSDADPGVNTGSAYAFDAGALGQWQNLGGALPGTLGAPQLIGEGTLLPGDPTTLTLSQALPGAPAFLVYGVTAANVPLYGGTLVPNPFPPGGVFSPIVIPAAPLPISAIWPPGVPSGTTLYFQYWMVDSGGPQGHAASNGLAATTP